jgi:hypothetical protein
MLTAEDLLAGARAATGLEDLGAEPPLEALERLTAALSAEADLTDLGRSILGLRLGGLLESRLRVEATYAAHPEIEQVALPAPLFIIGLPRTGTTALSNLLAADPQIRSLRLWESSEPVPPPEAGTQDRDPRIERAAAGLEAMYDAFPKMRALHFQTPTGPSECQDLLGMSMRTAHFDGMARVPSYTRWVVDCDMGPAYRYHRRVLQLLRWHCPPDTWHLKTPVHMLALPALLEAYPDARFLWTHRDPAAVLGSVCSLIAYVRSWVSDRDDRLELGAEQPAFWAEATARAVAVRDALGEDRFADVPFDVLNEDPVGAVAGAFERLGVPFAAGSRAAVAAWARAHPPKAHGTHEYALDDFGLTAEQVRSRFAFYFDRLDVPA